MKYVLDSSIGVKWVLPEADSAKALELRDDIRNKVHEVIAPDMFPIEAAHALTKAQRQGRIAQPDAYALWVQIMKDAPPLLPSLPLMPRAFALSTQNRIGIYDCLYISLSEQEQCQVVSADTKLVMLFPSQVISLDSL